MWPNTKQNSKKFKAILVITCISIILIIQSCKGVVIGDGGWKGSVFFPVHPTVYDNTYLPLSHEHNVGLHFIGGYGDGTEAEKSNIGWIFGHRHEGNEIGTEKELRLEEDSKALYDVMEDIVRLYYQTNQNGEIDLESPWIDKMINAIGQSAFFNTQRMVQEYYQKMWKA